MFYIIFRIAGLLVFPLVKTLATCIHKSTTLIRTASVPITDGSHYNGEHFAHAQPHLSVTACIGARICSLTCLAVRQ